MHVLTKNLFRLSLLTCGILSALPNVSNAGRFQPFSGLNYRNPAEMALQVKDTQFIIGDDRVDPRLSFDGTVFVPNPFFKVPAVNNVPILRNRLKNVSSTGHSATDGIYNLPYGRLAKRLNPDYPWVIGIDVTEPFAININYPNNQPVKYAGTLFEVRTVDVAPNIAYKFSGRLENLAVGAGLDFLYMWDNFNSSYPGPTLAPRTPTTPAFGSGPDSVGMVGINGKALGGHIGALYRIFKPTIVSLSYFTPMSVDLTGWSSYSYPYSTNSSIPINKTSNDVNGTLKLPATSVFNLIQFFSPTWKTIFGVSWTGWGRLKTFNLNNVAGPTSTLVADLNYDNTWRYSVFNNFALTDKWNFSQLVAYENVPATASSRTATIPSANSVAAGVVLEYRIKKEVGISADYTHVWLQKNIPIDHVSNAGIITNGVSNAFANVLGVRLTVDI